MTSKEPMNLREWRTATAASQRGRLFTCGRPGRATYGRDYKGRIDDKTIDQWIRGQPEAEVLYIISLLGEKTNGFSEFGYYPFRSAKGAGTNRRFRSGSMSATARFIVHEFPTVDAAPGGIQASVLEAVTHDVLELIEKNCTVVLVDSAGAQRQQGPRGDWIQKRIANEPQSDNRT